MQKEGELFFSESLFYLSLGVFALLLLFSFVGVSNAAVEYTAGNTINDCGNLTQAGTYTMNMNITMQTGYGSSIFKDLYEVCLTVQADNVVINGNNYSLIGNGTGNTIGVLTASSGIRAYTPLTLQNITIWNFTTEVYAAGDGANTAGGSVKFIDDIINLTGFQITLNGTGTTTAGTLTLNFTQGIEDDVNSATRQNSSFGQNISLWIINRSIGEIKWWNELNSTNLGKGRFGTNISINNNSAFVYGGFDYGLNKTANVTFYGINTGINTPEIVKDNGAACSDCYNFTALDAGLVIFNVTSWSNYSISDLTGPTLTVNFPTNTTYNETSLSFNFNISLGENGSALYGLEHVPTGIEANFTMLNSADHVSIFGTELNRTNSSLIEGQYIFRVYANDTSGNKNYTENVYFAYDNSNPNVTNLIPSTANTWFNVTNTIEIGANFSDFIGLSSGSVTANLTLPNGTHFALLLSNSQGNKYNTSYTISNGVNGTANITFVALDTQGHKNATENTSFFIIDNVAPNVTINVPIGTYASSTTSLNFNVSLSENGTVDYSLDGGVTNLSMVNSADGVSKFGKEFNYTNASVVAGTWTFSVYANDTLGNTNYTANNTFTVSAASSDTTSSSSSSGSGSGAVVGAIGPEELKKGVEKLIRRGTVIRFTLDKNGTSELHSVKFVKIMDGRVTFRLSSNEELEVELGVGESKKIDLDSDGHYDVLLEFIEMKVVSAKIRLTSISGNVIVEAEQEDVSMDEGTDLEKEGISEDSTDKYQKYVWIGGLILAVIVLVIVLIVVRKKRKY